MIRGAMILAAGFAIGYAKAFAELDTEEDKAFYRAVRRAQSRRTEDIIHHHTTESPQGETPS